MKKRLLLIANVLVIAGVTFGLSYTPKASATVPGTNELVSQSTSGTYPNAASGQFRSFISGNGRYVIYSSQATNLASGSGSSSVLMRDNQTGTTNLLATNSTGYHLMPMGLSYNGQYALVEFNDNAYGGSLLVYNTSTGTDSYVNSDDTLGGAISANGRYIVYSVNTNPDRQTSYYEVYIKDTVTNTTTLLSKDSSGDAANASSFPIGISCDGGIVAYASEATNLGGVNNTGGNIYVDQLGLNGITQSSIPDSEGGGGINVGQYGSENDGTVSCNGNIVAYNDTGNNLYEYDITTNTNTEVGAAPIGPTGEFSISDDGRYVATISPESSVSPSYTTTGRGGNYDVYIEDVKNNTAQLVSFTVAGNESGEVIAGISLSGDGSEVVYTYDTPSDTGTSHELVSGLTTGTSSSQQDVYESETGY